MLDTSSQLDSKRRPSSRVQAVAALFAIAVLVLVITSHRPAQPPPPPLGLPAVAWPPDNPYSPRKAALGRLLFFDKRLSVDNTIACASCHQPERAFTDGRPVAVGVRHQKGRRSAPTVLNRAYGTLQFWDGRAASLEEQAKGSIANPIEMDLPLEACVAKLRSVPEYRRHFGELFGTEAFNIDHVVKAIATYERTLLSGNSPYDRFRAGDRQALSPAAKRGMKLFFGKAQCNNCHSGPNFTDETFADTGIGLYQRPPDWGRYEATHLDHHRSVFKVPTVREVARTAPYMHDGSLKTLEKVVEYYNKGGNRTLAGGKENLAQDERIEPLHLTPGEKNDLVAFLNSLSSSS